jgi:hypothetical protein
MLQNENHSLEQKSWHFNLFAKSKWNLLYLILAVLIVFSVFAVPRIAVFVVEKTRGQVVTVESSGH